MELINFENVASVLEQYAQEVRNEYQDNLIRNDRISTGGLLNSVEYQVEFNDQLYEVSLTLQDYWKYIEEGVRGAENLSSPFSNPGWKAYPFIFKWISVKPVIPRPMMNGKLPTQSQLAFLITRSLKENGTQGGHELQKALDTINERYADKLVIALQEDLDVLMKVIVGDFHGTINVL